MNLPDHPIRRPGGRDGGVEPGRMVGMTLTLPIDPAANELLGRSPLALLIGMILDQLLAKAQQLVTFPE